MKKFNYFLLTLVTIFLTFSESNAFTAKMDNHSNIKQVFELTPAIAQQEIQHSRDALPPLEFQESHISSVNSVSRIENNLTILYSICVALVLFNLVAQIKIIYQMVNLFFLFQKKDEFASYNF